MSPKTGSFQPVDRLRRPAEFQQMIRRGRRVAGDAFVVMCSKQEESSRGMPGNRLGITVSRKVGNAVVRNRVKRRIREWFRADRSSLGPGVDLLVIGRSKAASQSHAALDAELSRLATAAVRSVRRSGTA